MEKIKVNLDRYKKKDTTLCKTQWQQFAKDTCQNFGVIHPYDKIVFKYAKHNFAFLKAQVTNLQEQANYKGESTKTYGRLLTYKLNAYKKAHAKKNTASLLPSATCIICHKPIKKKDHWRATSWTENGKTQTEFKHIKCCNIK